MFAKQESFNTKYYNYLENGGFENGRIFVDRQSRAELRPFQSLGSASDILLFVACFAALGLSTFVVVATRKAREYRMVRGS